MKKILLYTDTPQIGGAELQIFLLAKFLNKEKFTPILACSNYPTLNKWCENFAKENIKVIRLNVKHKHDPRHFFQLKKIIRTEKIDLIHAQIWNPASCRYSFSAAASTQIPLVITEHDPFKLSPLKNFFKKQTLKKVAKIIAISNDNKKLLSKLYPQQKSKIVVIKNSIDITWWQSQLLRFTQEDRKRIKEEIFNTQENTLIVITVAELHERKGLKYLIEAIPEITRKYPNIKFIFVGDGPNRENLEKLATKLKVENYVTFLGRQKEIPQLLKSADIFALPSRREAFGFVNLEAMITALPIVASKVGGIPEIVVDGKTGILVEPENSDALAKALLKLISDARLREKMGIAGQKTVYEKFDAKKTAREYEKVYGEILQFIKNL